MDIHPGNQQVQLIFRDFPLNDCTVQTDHNFLSAEDSMEMGHIVLATFFGIKILLKQGILP